MKKINTIFIALLALSTQCVLGIKEQSSLDQLIIQSVAICQGTVIGSTTIEKTQYASLFTLTDFTVTQSFKGHFADTLQIEHRGGELNGRGETYCDRPIFTPDTSYLLFLGIRKNGTLYSIAYFKNATQLLSQLRQRVKKHKLVGHDLSDHPALPRILSRQNVLSGSTGYSSRFLKGDRDEPIEYLVDVDSLPEGVTTNQALTAISNAFAAWAEVTSLTFKFAGIESFGMAAPDVPAADDRIRIQLHDNYNYISGHVVGRGGRRYSYNTNQWPHGGLGGRVGVHEFDLTVHGYIVLESTNPLLSDLKTLEEVLCHEIGHALSLAHSSEDPDESDATLADAMMYYRAHHDDRGAKLTSWDATTIQSIYPIENTPPYGYDRIIEAITSPTSPTFSSGVNQVTVRAFDRQGGAVPVLLDENANEDNGTFTLVNTNIVFFTPAGYFSDATTALPGSYYAIRYLRMDDGVNQSPPIAVRVVSFNADANADLLPDSWAAEYGIENSLSDADGDGFTNKEEWELGTDPTDPHSGLIATLKGTTLSWQSKSGDLYQIISSPSLGVA